MYGPEVLVNHHRLKCMITDNQVSEFHLREALRCKEKTDRKSASRITHRAVIPTQL